MQQAGYEFGAPHEMRGSIVAALGSVPLEQLAQQEISLAVANVPCIAAYNDGFRSLVVERFGEFKFELETALQSGVTPEGQG